MSTTNSATAAWLTQEAFDRLKAELDHLSGAGRAEIVQKIEAARQEGDLKENGGYHAAKEEQGKIEARIRQLTVLLRDAQVDHKVPLFKVWREHRHEPWPHLLAFWGAPNLQVITREAHTTKCSREANGRARARRNDILPESMSP